MQGVGSAMTDCCSSGAWRQWVAVLLSGPDHTPCWDVFTRQAVSHLASSLQVAASNVYLCVHLISNLMSSVSSSQHTTQLNQDAVFWLLHACRTVVAFYRTEDFPQLAAEQDRVGCRLQRGVSNRSILMAVSSDQIQVCTHLMKQPSENAC
jgi:hypothetical protein